MVIHNVHVTVIINPETTHDDVMNGRGYFMPRVVIVCLVKTQVRNTCKISYKMQVDLYSNRLDLAMLSSSSKRDGYTDFRIPGHV